jgi:hypothetical protein
MRNVFLVLCLCVIPFSTLQGQELVANGDFSAPLTPEWIVGNWETGFSTYGITNGVFHLTPTVIGTAAWMVFFYHFQDIKLKAGVNYIYKFTSHATAASTITTEVKPVGQPPAVVPWISIPGVIIGTTDSTYSFPFSTTADSDSGQVNFFLGFGNVPLGETIYIDNVSIQADQTPVVSKVNAAVSEAILQMTRSGVVVNLARPDKAQMKLYNLRGAQIADYSSDLRALTAGSHKINFGTRPVSNGTYLLKVNNGTRTMASTITIVK